MSFPKENVTEKRTVYILELIKKNERINTEEKAKNFNVSKQTTLRDIEKLKKQNRIVYVGPVKSGYWKILGKYKTLNSKFKTVVASKSHLTPETQQFIDDLKMKYEQVNTISKGSSLKLCMVAEDSADYYPRFAPTMEWDTAAGQAISMAAGCEVIDQETEKTMLYNCEELLNKWFLVNRTVNSEF